ncbi:cytochrome b6f subunit PetP [Kamptonema formosum]|uniref:cytochrome b6f subunit PetP n=1 Tax=Kamptonema formosum TaxID=331992 RepID=UPI00034AE512
MEIGQKVRVRRLRDRLPANTVSKIKQNPVGTVEEFKVVDGKGIGFLVKFDDTFATWFFEDELEVASQ